MSFGRKRRFILFILCILVFLSSGGISHFTFLCDLPLPTSARNRDIARHPFHYLQFSYGFSVSTSVHLCVPSSFSLR